ncbi:MAG: A/G-specific adenine glycosylase, partial [Fibrobacterota bacterium]
IRNHISVISSKKYNPDSCSDVKAFRKQILSFYNQNGRDLPWRKDFDSYRIFVSEVMLQQTQVERVRSKFILFVEEIPDFESLARAGMNTIYPLWQGLGYNRRALALRNAALMIVDQHKGILPDTPEELVRLPGIGPATGASITAFAYNKPVVFLETNIRTVLIHHFFPDHDRVHDRDLFKTAEKVLDRRNPRIWYSALMDYGTVLKKEVGNLSGKSLQFKKQSPFKGSNRQLRGAILKMLNETGSVSMDKLTEKVNRPYGQVIDAVNALVKEAMVREKSGVYSLME